MRSGTFVFLGISFICLPALAADLESMTLEDLLNIKVSVASKKATTTRQSPGIVSVITGEEVKAMGARDLIDVLHMVPGIAFGSDGYNTVSIAVRGMWAGEGKFLLLIDGQEMNELLYSSVQLGNRYSVDIIKQVEVIRGPGSVAYGGNAELAVVKVTTKAGIDLLGCEASGKYGQMKRVYGRRNLTVACGHKRKGVDFSISHFSGEANRSDRHFDAFGYDFNDNAQVDSYNFGHDNHMTSQFTNVGVSSDKVEFRFMREHYATTSRSYNGWAESQRGIQIDYSGYFAGALYKAQLSESMKLTPFLNFKSQVPWQTIDHEGTKPGGFYLNVQAQRLHGGLGLTYEPSSNWNFLTGVEGYQDKAKHLDEVAATLPGVGNLFLRGDVMRKELYNFAAYTQGQYDMGAMSVVLGGRFDDHSEVGNSFVPRLALTYARERWHAKALAAQAFRQPGIMNVDIAPAGTSLKPERTTTFEVESGVQLGDSYLTGNIFRTRVEDPIVYGYDATSEYYFNADETSTQGFELEHKIKKRWGYSTLTYSYYEAVDDQPVAIQVPGESKDLLGFSRHKVTYNLQVALSRAVRVNPSVIYLDRYFAYDGDHATMSEVLREYGPHVLTNLFMTYQPKAMKGFTLGFGVMNIFDNDYRVAQPYETGNHPPTPMPSREFVLRADYSLIF